VTLTATPADKDKRLDHYLQERLPEFSRSRLQEWIKGGRVLIDGKQQKPSYAIRGLESIEVTPAALPPLRASAEDLPIEVLYEDSAVIAVNKPAGMVVHSGAGNHAGTLTNALLHHFESLSQVGGDLRPGIVHRIDRHTSGVLLVARTDEAHRNLAAQFAARTVEKTYRALVHGRMGPDAGRITTPIIRDPVRRTRMTTKLGRGRNALTNWKVLDRSATMTYLEVKIGTGRTHQIRVHLASVGHPVAGDTLYGAPHSTYGRYFLHAAEIAFDSPAKGDRIQVAAPLPADLTLWLAREFDHVDVTPR
jgi:23S rRNA pseudouridine1911/1915/1917 synthase